MEVVALSWPDFIKGKERRRKASSTHKDNHLFLHHRAWVMPSFPILVTLYVSEKGPFANDIEQFWKKIHEERSVKIANCLTALARVFAI